MYHYTDLNGFISILQNKKLWLTSTNAMNDHQEVNWFRNIVFEKIKKIIDFDVLKENQIDMVKSFCDGFKSEIYNPHICCFSENGDLLSQWRAYANDASGLSIGFDISRLNISYELPQLKTTYRENLTLNSVIYNLSEQEEKAEEIVIKLLGYIEEVVLDRDDFSLFSKISSLFNEGLAYSFISKNNAFSEERERRIINLPFSTNDGSWHGCNDKPKFRAAGGTIASYFEFEFTDEAVTDVYVGPKCQVSVYDMEVFLKSIGLKHVKINKSKASYK